MKTGPHFAFSGPSACVPGRLGAKSAVVETLEGVRGRARDKRDPAHTGINRCQAGMGAGGRRLRTGICSVHLQVTPSQSARPNPLQAPHPHQEPRCKLEMAGVGWGGVRRGAALGSYTMLLSSTGHVSMPASPFWQRVRIAELDGRRGGRHLSVCRSLPTLKHEGWKSIWGPEKVSVPAYDCHPSPPLPCPSCPSLLRPAPG